MKFRICTVGCGDIAQRAHGPSWRKFASLVSGVELAACCDLDREKAEAFRRKFGFARSYADIDGMLEAEKPDAVCLIVPMRSACAPAVRILSKGYPLLLEKPPGICRNETLDIIRAAGNGGAPNMVAFNRRHIPLVRKLRETLGSLKPPEGEMNVRYCMSRSGRDESDFAFTAIHGIDLVRYIVGSDYEHVRFQYHELNHIGKGVADISMLCEFESGACAQLGFYPVSGSVDERLTVTACRKTFELDIPVLGSDIGSGKLAVYENGGMISEVSNRTTAQGEEDFILCGFYDENREFFESVINGKRISGDIQSGLQPVEIADCILGRRAEYRRSANRG